MMALNQLVLAAKAGGRYLSLFGGRIDDEGNDASAVIRACREWLDRNADACPNHPEIIVGSTRTTRNIADWTAAGAHILTVTPEILDRMVVNARTKETVRDFLADGEKALASIHGGKL
jgi:transaldolase